MAGGMVSDVVRVGNTVRRPLRRWSPAVHDLLGFLDKAGFEAAPRVLGVDASGRETLTWLPGRSISRPWPAGFRTTAGLAGAVRLLRAYHEIVAGYSPPVGARWWTGRRALQDGELICHGDVTPWNIIWNDGSATGLIDWDFAEPAVPLFDLAKLAFYATPMRDDQYCAECGLDDPSTRRDRIAAICDAYGGVNPSRLIDAVDHYLVSDLARMVKYGPRGVEPWKGFMARGLLEEHGQFLSWFRSNRHRVQPE